jgi:site-specific DNA-methyltransferase (adenine-specific)
MAVAIEDAGFQIRDQIMWVYGSGFPKSLNISKSIEAKITTGSANKTAFKNLKGEQIERGNWGIAKQQFDHGQRDTNYDETAGETRLGNLEATTPEAKQWDGWGTALKPAHEPMVLARKPLVGTVADNVLTYGTGGLNIDGSRVVADGENFDNLKSRPIGKLNTRRNDETDEEFDARVGESPEQQEALAKLKELGRFPANVIHDGSWEVLELFPQSNGGASPKKSNVASGKFYEGGWGNVANEERIEFGSGSAARFFYCAKASKRDRNEGLVGFENKRPAYESHRPNYENTKGIETPFAGTGRGGKDFKNFHPTVKPTDLMRYLCRLITPPNGIVLDPFMGSGSTGKAAMLEGFDFIGIEQEIDYLKIAQARIEHAVVAQMAGAEE